jgi:RNA polymerase sigma-70 factor (sigma-E family)
MTQAVDDEFSEFVRQTSGRLLATAYVLTGDRGRAEDLTQTAYAKTYVAWSRIRGDDAYGFVRKVLVNSNIDWWRRRSRQILSVRLPDTEVQPDHAGQVADRHAIAAALSTLGRRERAVVVLRYYSDLSEVEVAATLGITVGTVKSAASRALAKLRAHSSASQLGVSASHTGDSR